MSTSVTFNGASFTVPAIADASWGQNVTNYLIALSTGSLQKTGGSFTLSQADVDFGATYGLKSAYYKSRNAVTAAAGVIRLGNFEQINWRNFGNTADNILTSDVTDVLRYNTAKVLLTGNVLTSDLASGFVLPPNLGGTGVANNALSTITVTGAYGTTFTVTAATALTLPISGTLATLANAETLSNKTLTTPVQSSYEDFTDISTPAAPASGKTRIYSKNGNVYKQTATLPETLLGGGSGSGSKNYLSASTSTAAGWASTGTATATTDTTTSDLPEPSVGTGVLFTLGTAGNYSYARWTLDPADYNSPRIILKAAIKTLSSYASGNAKIEVYSNTASNYSGTSTRLALSTDVSAVSGLTTAQNYLGYYDNPGSYAPYMELRIVTVTATGTLCMSSISTGPGQSVQGALVTAPQTFTPTYTNLTVGAGTNVGTWWREGSNLCVSVTTALGSGAAVSAAIWTLNLSSIQAGLTIDTSLITVGNEVRVGDATFRNSGSSYLAYDGSVHTQAGQTGQLQFLAHAQNGYNTNAVPFTFKSGDIIEYNFIVPIAQWAGSGVVNLAQNDLQYYYGTGTWGTGATLTTQQGQGGVLGGTTTPSGNGFVFILPPTTPIPVGSKAVLEVSPDQKHWNNVGAFTGSTDSPVSTLSYDGTNYYGCGASVNAAGNIEVVFGKYASGVAASPYAWSNLSTWYWRVTVGLPGQVVGVGPYTPGVSSGLVPAAGLPGKTNGAATTGNIGETVTFTLGATAWGSSSSVSNVGSYTLQPGVWAVSGSGEINTSGTTVAPEPGSASMWHAATNAASIISGQGFQIQNAALSAGSNGVARTWRNPLPIIVLAPTVATTYYVNALNQYTTLGGATNTAYITAVRIT